MLRSSGHYEGVFMEGHDSLPTPLFTKPQSLTQNMTNTLKSSTCSVVSQVNMYMILVEHLVVFVSDAAAE